MIMMNGEVDETPFVLLDQDEHTFTRARAVQFTFSARKRYGAGLKSEDCHIFHAHARFCMNNNFHFSCTVCVGMCTLPFLLNHSFIASSSPTSSPFFMNGFSVDSTGYFGFYAKLRPGLLPTLPYKTNSWRLFII